MLKNIPNILSPELLKRLCELGHGDEFVIADGNFPCYGVNDNVIRADGHGVCELLKAIMQLVPVDTYATGNVGIMEVVKGDNYKPVIIEEYKNILAQAEGENVKIFSLERFEFYERCKKARFVIATSEKALYANIIIKKGVV